MYDKNVSAIESLYYRVIGENRTKEMADTERVLDAKLSAVCEETGKLDAVMEIVSDYADAYQRNGFVRGFRCAMRLMMDVGGRTYE